MAVLEHDRFRNFVYGVALTLMIGYVLYIGRNVFIPVIASVILAYIVIALAHTGIGGSNAEVMMEDASLPLAGEDGQMANGIWVVALVASAHKQVDAANCVKNLCC